MKRSVHWAVGAGLVLASCGVVWFYALEPIRTHRHWERGVRADLKSLEQKRPPDVTPDQWCHVVSWTLNLHGNCAGMHYSVEPSWRNDFAAELKHRLERGVTLADVEWIWDEYAKHTKDGQLYSDRYHPIRDPIFKELK